MVTNENPRSAARHVFALQYLKALLSGDVEGAHQIAERLTDEGLIEGLTSSAIVMAFTISSVSEISAMEAIDELLEAAVENADADF